MILNRGTKIVPLTVSKKLLGNYPFIFATELLF